MTDVIYRVDKRDGAVFALFPHEVFDRRGNVVCYAHIGQHGAADYRHCIQRSRPAIESELAPLKVELQRIGYVDLKEVSRQKGDKWRAAIRAAREI